MELLILIFSSVIYCIISAFVVSKMMDRKIKSYFQLHLRTHLTDMGVATVPEQAITTVDK